MSRVEEMRELFARWKTSGQSLMAFGKEEGVAYSKLLYWRRKLCDQGSAGTSSTGSPARLIPVRVVPDSKEATSLPEPFEVWLANGVALNVGVGFDELELRRLVDVLSAC